MFLLWWWWWLWENIEYDRDGVDGDFRDDDRDGDSDDDEIVKTHISKTSGKANSWVGLNWIELNGGMILNVDRDGDSNDDDRK